MKEGSQSAKANEGVNEVGQGVSGTFRRKRRVSRGNKMRRKKDGTREDSEKERIDCLVHELAQEVDSWG